jgi:thiol-disulfide isomerase/thioredoxin
VLREHPRSAAAATILSQQLFEMLLATSGATPSIAPDEPLLAQAQAIAEQVAQAAQPASGAGAGNAHRLVADLALSATPPNIDLALAQLRRAAPIASDTNASWVFGHLLVKLADLGRAGDALPISEIGAQRMAEDDPAVAMPEVQSTLWAARAYVFATLQRPQEAKDALAEIERRGLSVDPVAYLASSRAAALQGRLDDAESALLDAMLSDPMAHAHERVQAEISALYVQRHGSTAGLARYRSQLGARLVELRKAKVLGARTESPRRRPDFVLVDLQGRTVRAADLDGKVAVVHFWAPWCTPCLWEIEQYEQLTRSRLRRDVVFVSVVGNSSVSELQAFMSERRFTFMAALSDPENPGLAVPGWPTTWFLDREGYIQFETMGATANLAEEYRWRLEALLAP